MISYALAVLAIAAATLIPTYVALYLVTNVKIPTKYLALLGLGLTIWFFFDTFNDAIQLDVNQAFTGGAGHVGHVVDFLAGIATLAAFDYFVVRKYKSSSSVIGASLNTMRASVSQVPAASSSSNESPYIVLKYLILVPVAVAFVMGIHSLGEGWDFGAASSFATTQTLANAFGNLSALASYPMHKFLESTIVACVYAIYVKRSSAQKRSWHLPLLGLLFGGTSIIGTALGYYNTWVDTSYFFAFGVTSAFYAILRLSEGISLNFKAGENAPQFLGWKAFATLMIGFFLLYFAALFH